MIDGTLTRGSNGSVSCAMWIPCFLPGSWTPEAYILPLQSS
jgi:hypothetical protein